MKYLVVKTSQYLRYQSLNRYVVYSTMDFTKAKEFADENNRQQNTNAYSVYCKV